MMLAFAIIGFFSCTKEVKIDLPKAEQKMVVNCLFTKDSNFLVNLTELNDAFDNQVYVINNAAISLYENDIFVEHLTPADPNGNYISSILPKEGKNYKIVCEHKNFPTAKASDYLPFIPNLISTSRIRDNVGFEPEREEAYSQFSISFKDNVIVKNYYEISLKVIYQIEGFVSLEIQQAYPFSFDIAVTDESVNNSFVFMESIVFTDNTFNGGEKTMSVNYYPPRYSENELIDSNYRVILYFREVSENYYNYKKGLYNHVYSQYGGFGIGAGNPIDMYNNIENGYGVFAGYTQVIDTITR